MSEKKTYFGTVLKTVWNPNYEYICNIQLEEGVFEVKFKHNRTYMIDDGDKIQLRGELEYSTNQVKKIEELWVKVV